MSLQDALKQSGATEQEIKDILGRAAKGELSGEAVDDLMTKVLAAKNIARDEFDGMVKLQESVERWIRYLVQAAKRVGDSSPFFINTTIPTAGQSQERQAEDARRDLGGHGADRAAAEGAGGDGGLARGDRGRHRQGHRTGPLGRGHLGDHVKGWVIVACYSQIHVSFIL